MIILIRWSDNSSIWNTIDQHVKDTLQFKKDKDGEFW